MQVCFFSFSPLRNLRSTKVSQSASAATRTTVKQGNTSGPDSGSLTPSALQYSDPRNNLSYKELHAVNTQNFAHSATCPGSGWREGGAMKGQLWAPPGAFSHLPGSPPAPGFSQHLQQQPKAIFMLLHIIVTLFYNLFVFISSICPLWD